MNLETATVGGGCFWCVEAIFNRVRGVHSALSGYAAGHTENPSYQDVCTGQTGHAEVVQISFDPNIISYRDILDIFFHIHDPTTLNRQGADRGTQYRSIILYHSDQQKSIAETVIQQLSDEKIYPATIVTQLEPLDTFYKAETYHQNYFTNNPGNGYCQMVIAPKLKKIMESYKKP